MEKIISLFQRNYDGDRLVRDEVVPGAEWVQNGEGIATRKWDGTCVLIRGGNLYKRYDAKHGKQPPADFEPAQEPDPITGHWPGWIPVRPDDPSSKWHTQAFYSGPPDLEDGTYEVCGPHFQTNPEHFHSDVLIRHGTEQYPDCPRTFDALREWLAERDIEGIVWHHPDGQMVKIKGKDFGIKRSAVHDAVMATA